MDNKVISMLKLLHIVSAVISQKVTDGSFCVQREAECSLGDLQTN